MKILEKEIQLRDETRNAEQVWAAAKTDAGEDEEKLDEVDSKHHQRSLALADRQELLNERMDTVIEKIYALPDAEANFRKELGLLTRVSEVMIEATSILSEPNTGPDAVAAETEIIELLLQTRRIQPKGGGGGGGSTPGGGGGGTTKQAALAMVGPGADSGAFIEDRQVGQATGQAGRQLPAEYQSGLDEYFGELDGQ